MKNRFGMPPIYGMEQFRGNEKPSDAAPTLIVGCSQVAPVF